MAEFVARGVFRFDEFIPQADPQGQLGRIDPVGSSRAANHCPSVAAIPYVLV